MRPNRPVIEGELEAAGHAPDKPGRALVAVPSVATADATVHYGFHPDSSFVAHLIAAAANAPQTRMLRRSSTEDALASYRDTTNRDQESLRAGTKRSLVA
jgi:hypothetical protein